MGRQRQQLKHSGTAAGASNGGAGDVSVEQVGEQQILAVRNLTNANLKAFTTYQRFQSRVNKAGNVLIERGLAKDPLAKMKLGHPFADKLLRERVPMALTPAVARHAHCNGQRIVGQPPLEPLTTLPKRIQALYPCSTTDRLQDHKSKATVAALQQFAQSHRTYLVRRNSRVRVEWLIAQIVLGFPSQRVAIAVQSHARARRLARSLRRFTGMRANSLRARCAISEAAWINVSVPSSLWIDDAQKSEILVLLEPERMLGESANDTLDICQSKRIIGIMDEATALSEYERRQLTRRLGFVSLAIPKEGQFERRTAVGFLPFAHRSKLPADTSLLECKRVEIWHGKRRNALIAKTAREFAAKCPVGVIVENLGHAVELARLIQGARIAVDDLERGHWMTRSSRRILAERAIEFGKLRSRRGRERQLRRSSVWIISYADIGPIDLGQLRLFIRADGGFDFADRIRALLTTTAIERLDVALVDINDRGHPHLVRASKSRRSACFARLGTPGPNLTQATIQNWINGQMRGAN